MKNRLSGKFFFMIFNEFISNGSFLELFKSEMDQ